MDEKRLTFLHDSIRDYLAAEYIRSLWLTEEKKARRYIRKQRSNSDWGESITFLSGLLENRDALLRALAWPLWLEFLEACERPNQVLLTAAKCAGVYPGNSAHYGERLVNRLIRIVDSDGKYLGLSDHPDHWGQKFLNGLIRVIMSRLVDIDYYVRVNAIKALSQVDSYGSMECLSRFLRKYLSHDYSPDFSVARTVIEAVSEIRTEAAGSLLLIQALAFISDNAGTDPKEDTVENSPQSVVLGDIIKGLQRLNSPKTMGQAVEISLRSENDRIRAEFSDRLNHRTLFGEVADLLPIESFPYLMTAALFDKSEEVRHNAGRACWKRFPTETEECILKVIEDPESTVLTKYKAILTTHNLIAFAWVSREKLKQILFDYSIPGLIRSETITPLIWGRGINGEISEILDKCVRDRSIHVKRCVATVVVDEFHTHSYDKYLLQLLCDDEPSVYELAAIGLIRHGDDLMIRKLRDLLDTDIGRERRSVVEDTIAATEQTMVFSVESSELQSDLDDAMVVSERLRQVFESIGRSISERAEVYTMKAGSKWCIKDRRRYMDNTGQHINESYGEYLIVKEGDHLKVYDKTLGSDRSEKGLLESRVLRYFQKIRGCTS